MSEEIDHSYTREVVCPHCGHEHRDSWEYSGGEEGDIGTIECGECGKEFSAYRHIQVTYITKKELS